MALSHHKKKQAAILAVGFLMLVYTAYVTPLILSPDSEGDFMFAAAAKGVSGVLNVYTRPAEQYLRLDAPIFSFLPLDRAIFNPKTILQAITKTATPVSNATVTKAVTPSFVTLPQTTENTIVNIFCSQKLAGNLRKTVTGSGVLINSDGTVLTNAHVAEYPLVADSRNDVTCLARSGSPASHSYSVKTVFISPEWVNANGKYISTGGNPETGQSDYALLKISNPDKSPLNLRTAPIQQTNGSNGSVVNAVSYPADVLGTKGVNTALYIQKDTVAITDQYLFSGLPVTNSQADIIETAPSSVGQIGSSGGSLTDPQDNLIGLITMTTGNSIQGKKAIRAITISHIHKDLGTYFNGGLVEIVRSGSADLQSNFNIRYRVALTSLLSGSLSSSQ